MCAARVISVEDLQSELAGSCRGEWVLVRASFNPGGRVRFFLFTRAGNELPQEVGWFRLPRGDVKAVEAALAASARVFTGVCDAMYATPCRRLWWREHAGGREREVLHVCVRPEATLLEATQAGLEQILPRSRAFWPSAHIERVQVALSKDWYRRSVSMWIRQPGDVQSREVCLVAEVDSVVFLDPCYSGLELELDTAWLAGLGRALADICRVPLELHPDLR